MADSLFTRFSKLRIVDGYELVSHGRGGNWYPDGRQVDGTRLAGSDWRLVFETTIYWRPDSDVVVLKRLETSNACIGRYQFILMTSDGNARASNPSKSCSGSIIAMRVSHEAIELDTGLRRPDLTHLTIRFDGETLQEIEVLRDDSGAEIAGAGPDVTRWVGTHIAEILDQSSERLRFGTIMRPEDL